MSAKNCVVLVNHKDGSTTVRPTDRERLSKKDAQRHATEVVKEAGVHSAHVVQDVMEIRA